MITEVKDGISRIYAEVIQNKTIEIIMPIICERVVSGSEIHTDEHRTYFALSRHGFRHKSVCHKYMFINRENNCNTQVVESINNEIKLEIKRSKGILTSSRSLFLSEFIWMWNNKTNPVIAIYRLLKYN